MASDISTDLRRTVMERANHCCEYCRLPQAFATYKHEPDHIIPHQHGGATESDNLACTCMRCNRRKGPNVASYDSITGELTPLFNPRTQQWSDHIQLDNGEIRPLSPEARITVKLLDINNVQRVLERRRLIAAGII